MGVYERKQNLYRSYVSEMEAVTGQKIFENSEDLKKTIDTYINEDWARWMNIWADEYTLAGFLIVCRAPECHRHADYYIAQAYISPECRGQGLMKGRLDEYLAGHRGVYCLHVLDGNEAAVNFWDHYFLERAGYKRAKLKDEDGAKAGLTILSYKPKN